MEIFMLLEFIALAVVSVAIIVENKKLSDELVDAYRKLCYEKKSKQILREIIDDLRKDRDE